MRVERTSFGTLPPVRRQGNRVSWCDEHGRHLGERCPECHPRPACEPTREEPADVLGQPTSTLGAVLWAAVIALLLAGLIFAVSVSP